ncbi:MAG: Rne/Rng family ribonuclease [Acidobacteriaceae bacterium]
MAKEICISSTPHETRLAILEDDQLAEIYYERENEYTLAGSIYKGRVTRVLPGMQSAFVDLGLERDAFLYVTDFLEEQEEDSEEFDAGGGNGRRRESRESGARGGESREARPRSDRSDRDRPERQDRPDRAPESDLSAAESPRRSDSDRGQDRGQDHDQAGARRWHGRRGRRFRGRSDRPDSPSEPRSDSRSESRSPSRPESRSQSRYDQTPLQSAQIVEEAIASEPVVLPERGAPGGIPAHNLPIVLPGESLSKYGGGGRSESRSRSGAPSGSAPVSRGASKPSTMVEVTGGWDGGNVLPGESLSRHRRSEPSGHSQTAPVVSAPAEFASPSSFSEAPSESHLEAAVAPVESSSEPQASAVSPAPAAPESLEAVVPPLASSTPHFEETVEEVREYEPEQASASHRVELQRSEFRFSPPEVPAIQEAENSEHDSEEFEEIADEEEQAPAGQANGTSLAETAPAAAASSEPTSAEAEVVRQLFGYAPGMGVLEEETIDEDEYDFEPIPGQPDEHLTDEMEEQTLDNGATVEDAVRDVHIEKRLGYDTAAEADEDEATDDLESGFAEIEESEFEESEESETEEEGDEPSSEQTGQDRSASGQSTRREGARRFDRRGGRGRQQQGGRRHGRRPNMQTSDLPIISELLRQGQEILVQIAKEPIARKGARITSHIALPGRFLVFMPTVNHVGVSRKIESDEERQRLKRILISEKGTAGGGFIVRTAAENAGEDDLRADIRFLINLWSEIKQRADSAKAPALLYHDLNLIERILRDQVSDNFSTIWVDSESEYERIVRFLNRFQPSLVRRVKLYTKETPLFEQFGIQEEISKALKSKVWLKSGGSIVINQTEALVAIDINTGKYVGKTARLEDTILRTNLDAIPEIVRQIRLRDLGGIIVIDFIDMDERRNRQKVTQALEDALQADRAPSKVLQFNDFGLVAITRKRVKQSLERTLSVPCPVCTGTGMVKSPTTVANEIWIELRKMMQHLERGDVLVRVHPEVVKVLKAGNGKWLNEMEEMIGKTIIVKSDPALPPEQFDIQG